MKPRSGFIILTLTFLCLAGWAQPSGLRDTLPPRDTLRTAPDSLSPALDFTTEFFAGNGREIRLSGDTLDAKVEYLARDSMIIDNVQKKIFLYGNASVTYTNISLTSNFIVLDWANNLVSAEGWPDSTGTVTGFPEFTQDAETYNARRMVYNFKTEKGIVYDVTTQQNDIIVHGSKTKFVRGVQRDSTLPPDDVLYSQDAIFTTCTLDHPHFGIRSRKQKVIPNKLVIVGPSQLEIMDVPTPIWLPFGFFPISKGGRATGLLFPRDYEYSQQWGFGLRDVGWFFPLGDHFNLSLRANIYLKGTWGISASSQYRKRYKYNGNFLLGFDSRKVENISDATISRNTSFQLQWSHNQDPSAHPTNTFGGSINIQTNNYQSRVFNDAANVLPTQLSSNMNFSKRWADQPLTLNVSLNHSQNTATREVNINFPNVKFLTQSIFPFKRQNRGGNKEQWYETIVLRYTGEARNRFQATDTTLFTQQTLNDAQFGVRHDVTMGSSFKILNYINVNPNVNYKEVWHWESLDRNFDPTITVLADTIYNADSSLFEVVFDTLSYGTINTDTLTGFAAWRTVNAGISLNTRLFATYQRNKGWLRGLRHEFRPTISFNYSPNYLNPDLGYYQEVQNDIRFPDDQQVFSVFQGALFGAPPRSGTQAGISYSFNNIFEGKFFSRRDSTVKKVKLIDNLFISGNYNFAADSLQWSQVAMRTTARFIKGVTTLGFNATFDPYIVDDAGRRVNTTVWADRRRPVRFDRATLRITSNLTVGKLREMFQGAEEEVITDVRQPRQRRAEPQAEDFLSLFENFSISHNIAFTWVRRDGKTELDVSTNSLNCRGTIQLTKNWGINVGNFGYDFIRNGLSYPSVGFQRDLHCWDMSLNWQPQRGTYSFNIRVKPGSLDFIKIPYQRNNADARRVFN